MRALLVFKKQIENGTTRYRFERRDMGCFNGLNRDNAFSPVSIHRGYLNNYVALFNESNNGVSFVPNGEIDDTSDYTFMALGWFTDYYADAAAARNVSMPVDFQLAEKLNLESFSRHNTLRSLTPNEQELKRLVDMIEVQNFDRVRSNNNLLYTIVRLNREYHSHISMDLVGSERNSGFAVAYLQVIRNASRVISDTSGISRNQTAKDAMRSILKLDGRSHTLVKYPGILFSAVFNGGSDSDIFSFAGKAVYQQAKAFGLFSLEQYFRDVRPMVEEGRYNKGDQSLVLKRNVESRYNSRNGVLFSDDGTNHADAITSACRRIDEARESIQLPEIVSNPIDQVVDQVRSLLNSHHVQNLRGVISAMGEVPIWEDLRTHREAGTQAVQSINTSGFTQWISTTDTIETE